MEHDERAASATRLGLRAGDECMREPTIAQRLLDPHRLQFAIAAPDDGGDPGYDATVVPSGKDPELLFLTERNGGRIVEVPVRWNDNPATKVRFLRDATRMVLDLIAIRWRALMGEYP